MIMVRVYTKKPADNVML